MAPFKLKFRMGGSRSTSQETDTESQPAQPLLSNNNNNNINNVMQSSMGASTTTIESINNSMTSLCDQKNLISNKTLDERIGYINPTVSQNSSSAVTNDNKKTPSSPPPSYEHVLEETKRLSFFDNATNDTFVVKELTPTSTQINLNENYSINNNYQQNTDFNYNHNSAYCCSSSVKTIMTSSSHEDLGNHGSGSCNPLCILQQTIEESLNCDQQPSEMIDEDNNNKNNNEEKTCDVTDSENQHQMEDNWNSIEIVDDEQQQQQQLQQHHPQESHQHLQQNVQSQQHLESSDTVISNKSSKKIYKAVARQWGITCEMSENCRCMECQSNYFDCEYDDNNEHHKTDGGLGAGTPMFISEAMHNTVCTIL